MERLGISRISPAIRQEPSYTWRSDGAYAGHILISDMRQASCGRSDIRAESRRRAQDGHAHRRSAEQAAEQVAEELGIDEVYSELLPGRTRWRRWKRLIEAGTEK